ncbi:MAG: type I-E CRISPR-associated protein Cas5/CasD [Phycisphaerae bacterium]|nr:type I-E CRISPR-associated protein Cas5/CasD [Phycisphaerae bacterium]
MCVPGSNTIFLRLEAPLQAWGDTSKFVIRRSMEAPTKSGLLGLVCCAMGWSRRKVAEDPIPDQNLHDLAQRLIKHDEKSQREPRRALLDLLNTLTMGVRMDRPGTRWWDYHTVGARIGMTTAAGGPPKTGAKGTVIKRLEYLADASFLVALQGDAILIGTVAEALRSPKWQLYLGRKSCPPSIPVLVTRRRDDGSLEPMIEEHASLETALSSLSLPWRPRHEENLREDDRVRRNGQPREKWKIALDYIWEWRRTGAEPVAPPDAEVWYDVPFSFDPPVHHPRLVRRDQVTVRVGDALQQHTPPPPRPRANYTNPQWTSEELVEVVDERTGEVTREPFGARPRRLRRDRGLCVFCKSPATTIQHVTYRRAGGNEAQEDLRSLCRLCHDAVTMIEYGLGMGLDRIDPCDVRWRDDILRTRGEIVRFRSEETRRRALRDAPQRVRREMLEEEDN